MKLEEAARRYCQSIASASARAELEAHLISFVSDMRKGRWNDYPETPDIDGVGHGHEPYDPMFFTPEFAKHRGYEGPFTVVLSTGEGVGADTLDDATRIYNNEPGSRMLLGAPKPLPKRKKRKRKKR